MRIAAISDVHGNLHALRAVLGAINRRGDVDRVVCAGDIVGLGPCPNEVVQLLAQEEIDSVKGNYDDTVASHRISSGVDFPDETSEKVDRMAVAWTRRSLNPETVDYLKALPFDIHLFDLGGRVKVKRNLEDERLTEYKKSLMTKILFGSLAQRKARPKLKRILVGHGSPRALNEFIGPETANSIMDAIVRVSHADVMISGHSGVSFVREHGGITFVGVGSVSGSRAQPGEAEYVIVDLGHDIDVEFGSATYDPSPHVQAMIDRGLPHALASRFNLSSL